MFNKGDEPGADTATPAHGYATPGGASSASSGGVEQSVISAGLKVIGNLESDGDILISGTVEGDISSRGVTVGQGASVQGSVEAESVQVMGRIDGQVRARAVKIARNGEVLGDVTYEALSVEEGALIDGQIRRGQTGRSGDSKVSKLTAVEGGAKKDESKQAAAGGASSGSGGAKAG